MKALLSTTLVLSAVTLAAVGLAAAALVAVIFGASPGFAADVTIPPNFVAPEFQGGVAPNRLDVYDLRREMAREAEHRRIHIRLGDPGPWCLPVAIRRPGMPYPGSPGCW